MGWYLIITSEMREAGLSGNGLLIYALVFGYSQEQDGCCYLSLASIANRVGCTPETARTTLRSLLDAGLVERFEFMDNGLHRVAYRTTPKIWDTQKISPNHPKNLVVPPKNFGIYNKVENKDEKKDDVYSARARFTPPTLEEVEQYCRMRGNTIDPQQFIDHYTANGWRVGNVQMRDWRAAVRTWESRRRNESPYPKSQRTQNLSPEERTMAALARLQARDGNLHTFQTPDEQ